jgi:hypothetical protein
MAEAYAVNITDEDTARAEQFIADKLATLETDSDPKPLAKFFVMLIKKNRSKQQIIEQVNQFLPETDLDKFMKWYVVFSNRGKFSPKPTKKNESILIFLFLFCSCQQIGLKLTWFQNFPHNKINQMVQS